MSEGQRKKDESPARPKIILGLIGSERNLGNCELFTKEISRNVPEEHELRLIRLPSLRIMPCRGCYRCINEGACPIEDDLGFVLDRMTEADAFIIAAPVYFLGIHAATKLFLDRAFAAYRILEETKNKPAILITTYGIKDRQGVAPQALRTLASFLRLQVKAVVNLEAALPGDALKEQYLPRAQALGRMFFQEKTAPLRGFCPYCGCDIVRRKAGRFICTFCHGVFSLDENQRPVKVKAGWNVNDPQFVYEHREWLKGMKDRFISRRKEIMNLTLPYKTIGTWLEPR
jgi:multimeric flavodoxin WrbA